MSDRLFLPARRGEIVIVFEHRDVPDNRRWEFVAAATQKGADGVLERTTAVPLSDDDLKTCAALVAQFPAFEAALRALPGQGIADLDLIDAALTLPKELAMVEGSALLTLTLYLQLIRNTLVTTASVTKYRSRPVEERVEAGLSGSAYQTLLKAHDLETGGELLDEDLAVRQRSPRRTRDWGIFYNMAGLIRQRRCEHEAALPLFRQSAKHAPDAALHRRIANTCADLDRIPEAIESFIAAEELAPLPAPATLRLAQWLKDEDRGEEARMFAERAKERGAKASDELLASLA